MQTSQLIEELASGNASVVKDILNDMLSTKAFESLDAKKIELARNMFNGSEIRVEEVDLDEEQLDEGDQFAKADHHYALSNHHDELASSHAEQGNTKKELFHKIKAETHMGKYHDHMTQAQKLPGKRLLGGSSNEHVKWSAASGKNKAKLQAELNKMAEEVDLDEEQK